VWKFQDFSVTRILCEIGVGESRTSKNGVFAILAALNLVNLADISLKEVQKFIKNQNSEPLNVLKRQILYFENP